MRDHAYSVPEKRQDPKQLAEEQVCIMVRGYNFHGGSLEPAIKVHRNNGQMHLAQTMILLLLVNLKLMVVFPNFVGCVCILGFPNFQMPISRFFRPGKIRVPRSSILA